MQELIAIAVGAVFDFPKFWARVRRQVCIDDGDIILMHEIYRNSYEAACIVIDALAAEGYEFVTVTELIGEGNLKVGKTYYNAN